MESSQLEIFFINRGALIKIPRIIKGGEKMFTFSRFFQIEHEGCKSI